MNGQISLSFELFLHRNVAHSKHMLFSPWNTEDDFTIIPFVQSI